MRHQALVNHFNFLHKQQRFVKKKEKFLDSRPSRINFLSASILKWMCLTRVLEKKWSFLMIHCAGRLLSSPFFIADSQSHLPPLKLNIFIQSHRKENNDKGSVVDGVASIRIDTIFRYISFYDVWIESLWRHRLSGSSRRQKIFIDNRKKVFAIIFSLALENKICWEGF